MRVRPSRLPVSVRLPLIAATMIFVAAVASTQTAIVVMGRQAERQAETLGHVYLDGLSAALLPHVVSGENSAVLATLRRALDFQQGIVDRQLAFIDRRNGSVIEAVRMDGLADSAMPKEISGRGDGFLRSEDGTVWIWRQLADGPTALGTVAANLDVSSFDAERSVLRWSLLLSDLAFSGICALLGYFMVRRIQRPVATVARHLYDAALGMLRPIDLRELPADDVQAERMINAFNVLVHATTERENLLTHLAEQQRQADLGRLTATIAHEVRNPLGGMRTAISTLKRFGDREEPRNEAVAFLERGVAALQQVVDATLQNYRARPDWRPLARQDFEDLRLLVQADGRSRDVGVILHLDVPDTMAVAALEVRQVLLNLLLNAVRASVRGGTVELTAIIQGDEIVVTVRDEGGGLDRSVADALKTGTAAAQRGSGLGVSVVIRLVERLHGRVAIESGVGTGTSITLRLPMQGERSGP